MANYPESIRRVPIKIEQAEKATSKIVNESEIKNNENSLKSNLYQKTKENPILQNNCQKQNSPNLAKFQTIYPCKPPQGKKNVPIQRNTSKEREDKTANFHKIQSERNDSDQPQEEKNEVDFNEIHTQLEVFILILFFKLRVNFLF